MPHHHTGPASVRSSLKARLPRAAGALAVAGLALGLSPIAAGQAPAADSAGRPNVVLILVDDMGYSDLGCYGSEIHTPNIDRLAAAGMRFTQFYNTAKCETTRSSLLSGLYSQEAGSGLRRGITLGQAMRAAGYSTLAVGKWHLAGNPVERGFDRYFGHLSGATNYFKGNDSFRLDDKPFEIPESGFYTTDANTDYAIRFLEESRQKHPDRPFFLYLAYNAPHYPLQAWPEDIARYRGKYLAGWDRLRAERYRRQLELGVVKPEWKLSPRPEAIPAWDSLSEPERQFEDLRMAVYAAMVDRLDQNIGRLMARLAEWGVEDNTLVMFLSDNGGCPFDRERTGQPGEPDSHWEYGLAWANLSDTPFRYYKRNQHEGGIATPLICRWPAAVKPGGICHEPGHLVDVAATLFELAGWTYPKTFEGQELPPLRGESLVPLLRGQPRAPHDALFFQFGNHRAVRAGGYKLVSVDGGPWELYRIDTDRSELDDLAGREPEKVRQLAARWQRWWDEASGGKPYNAKATAPLRYRRVIEDQKAGGDAAARKGKGKKAQ
jgi:arylsulfatase A-like enzyme